MTKAEQARLQGVAIQGAAAGRRRTAERRAHLPAFRHFPASLLPVEAAVRRARGGGPVRTGRARPHRSPTATPPEVVSKILYLRQHYHFGPGKIADYLKRFHQRRGGRLVGASHPGAARDEPAAGQSEASAARASAGSATRSRSPGTGCRWT